MVKKSIIAIALIGMLATMSYGAIDDGQGSYPVPPSDNQGQAPGQFKIDGKWPVTCTYTPVEICRIKIVMEVGMFIEIENCKDKKIVLKQVQCTGTQTFPCYKGCTEIRVRSNFEAKLGLKLYKSGSIISGGWAGDNWKAYFSGSADGAGLLPAGTTATTVISPVTGNWNKIDVCVEAWDANIYAVAPGTGNNAQPVGEVAVTAIPTAAIVCN